jgi:hypothetical protein
VSYFEILSRYLLGGTEENYKNLSNNERFVSLDLKLESPMYEAVVPNIQSLRPVLCVCVLLYTHFLNMALRLDSNITTKNL